MCCQYNRVLRRDITKDESKDTQVLPERKTPPEGSSAPSGPAVRAFRRTCGTLEVPPTKAGPH